MSDVKTNINWFPGHMARAIREIKEKINLVDMIIEVSDARAVFSSSNPIVKELCQNKFYLKVLTKIDLADDNETSNIKKGLENENIPCCCVNLNDKKQGNEIIKMIDKVATPLKEKDIKRGLKPRNVRVMVVGIPNVGKSTLINLLAKRNSAPVGNTPGFTRAQKWVKCNGFDLLDTPGILWPNLSDNQTGDKLALIGCIKEEILPTIDLLSIGLNYLNANYHEMLYNKYGIEYENFDDYLDKFSLKYGHLLKDGGHDLERSAKSILNDIKNGRVGKITFERWNADYGKL